MSEILSNIVVEQTSINFSPDNNNLNITPEAIQLNIFTSAAPIAGGANTQVQYNQDGVLGGSSAFTFNNSSNTVTIANIVATNSNLGNVANVKIAGGSNGQVLITDGTGNLSFTNTTPNPNYANFAGNVVNSAQPNITSVGTLTALNVNGSSNLGNVGNVKITGGTNGYVLTTDGLGNLDWAAGGGGGNGSPGGSNTQIQYNDTGTFGGTSGFTFNKTSNAVNMPGNLVVAANATATNFLGTVSTANQPNITSLGNLTALTVAGMTSIQEAKEKINLNSTPATGTVNFEVLNEALLYKTANASNNFTLNIRGNSTTTFNSIINTNESMTITFINSNGTTGYYANVIQIDGVSITPLYPLSVSATTGTPSGKDVYTFNIIKLGSNSYTVFGSRIGFK